MGQNAAAVDVNLVANGNIVTENSDVLQASPLSDGAVPANNGALHPGVVLDLGSRQEGTPLQADTITNDTVGADDHVGTDAAVLTDLGTGVDHDVAAIDVAFRGRDEQLGALLGQRREVQAGAGQEVLGLANIHPEAFEVEGVQLAFTDDGGEGLLLDRGGAVLLNAVQDGCVQNVDTGIDTVANELDGLLDEPVDARRVAGLVDNNTVFRGLLDLGDADGTLISVGSVEVDKLLEGELASNIRVEHEERLIVLTENILGQLQRTSSAQGFGLEGEVDVDSASLGDL